MGRRSRPAGAMPGRRRTRGHGDRGRRNAGGRARPRPGRIAGPRPDRSVAVATRLAVANARLQADVAARVREVDGLPAAAGGGGRRARRRLGEELRDGAERRLAAVRALSRLAVGREGETARVLARWSEAELAQADLDRFRAWRASARVDRTRPARRAGRSWRPVGGSRRARDGGAPLPRAGRRRCTSCARKPSPTSPSTRRRRSVRISVHGRPDRLSVDHRRQRARWRGPRARHRPARPRRSRGGTGRDAAGDKPAGRRDAAGRRAPLARSVDR